MIVCTIVTLENEKTIVFGCFSSFFTHNTISLEKVFFVWNFKSILVCIRVWVLCSSDCLHVLTHNDIQSMGRRWIWFQQEIERWRWIHLLSSYTCQACTGKSFSPYISLSLSLSLSLSETSFSGSTSLLYMCLWHDVCGNGFNASSTLHLPHTHLESHLQQ